MARSPFLMAGTLALAFACGIPTAVAQNLKADPLVEKCEKVASPYTKGDYILDIP
jgi:hypothetical protein